MTEIVELRVAGRAYTGWRTCEITRSLERGSSTARFEVTENQLLVAPEWIIKPFAECTIYAGNDLLMTGFVTEYAARIDQGQHVIRITVRSKTIDVVDSVSEQPFQQITGNYNLGAIARQLCALVHVEVDVQVDSGALNPMLFQNLFLDETIFGFLERLARTQQVLLTDNPLGQLVLTNAGYATSSNSIILGQNVLRASARYNVDHRFNKYMVRTQMGYQASNPSAAPSTTTVAVAYDRDVPGSRNRVHAITSEAPGVENLLQNRVDWMMKYARGQSRKVELTVPGWREGSGRVFTPNTNTPVDLPMLGVNNEMLLLVEVKYVCDERGFTSELRLGPVDGYKPDPSFALPHSDLISTPQPNVGPPAAH